MNYNEMNVKEIENILQIKPVDKLTVSFLNRNGQKTFSNWEQVEDFIKELRKRNKESFNCFITILGYEIVDKGKIHLHYNTHISYS